MLVIILFCEYFFVIPQVIFLLVGLKPKGRRRMRHACREIVETEAPTTRPMDIARKTPRPSAASDIGHPFVQRTEAKTAKKHQIRKKSRRPSKHSAHDIA